MAFLTELDDRAAVRGSRDPLGIVPLWSHFGRHLVGNLTTVTDSVRGFTTTLLGYYFAREIHEREVNRAESTLALFIKFEQFAGYCRYHAKKDGKFRGIDRVKRTVGQTVVRLSARAEDQILSNQKVYGLWGLYSGPARASSMLERDEALLTANATRFIEGQYIGYLSGKGFKDGRDVIELLRHPRAEVHPLGKHADLARAIAQIHGSKYSVAERQFYREHLIVGGPGDSTGGLQAQIAQLMAKLPADQAFDRRQLRALINEARRRGRGWESLTDRLRRVDLLESVLVPAEAVFRFLLSRHGQRLADVTREISRAWGLLRFIDTQAFRTLQLEVSEAFHAPSAGNQWAKIAEALAGGDYSALLQLLLEHNAFVMQMRGGSAPWVKAADRLDVRFRDEMSTLPDKNELPHMWRNNYFLNPLKDVITALET